MKVNKFFLLGAIGALLMTGCSADEEMTTGVQAPTNPNTLSIQVSDAGALTDSLGTRAAYSGLITTFENGDAIGVYAVTSDGTVMTSNAKFTKSGSSWTSSTDVVFNPEWTYYAYYPWVASPYNSDFSQTGIDNRFSTFIADASNKFHINNQSTKANYQASDLMLAEGECSGTNTVLFSMYHKKALAVLSGAGMSFTAFSTNIPYENGGNKYYLMKPSTSTSIGGKTVSAASGKYVNCVYSLSDIADAATDLSMYNTAGTLQANRNTANCYMVHDAGIYKIPLVYGNAIKGGATNSSAYTSGASGSYVLTNFVNHANYAITDPWIKNNKKTASANITVDDAELLWQDNNVLVNAVGVTGDWLVFRVPQAPSSKAGNAVIAVTDDGTIVWSWHIWVTTETYSTTTTVTTNATTYNVAPVNLGWVKAGRYCPYYQWGRKDAFLPSSEAANTDHNAYDINGKSITGINKVDISSNSYGSMPEIHGSIRNPMDFYYDDTGDKYRWYETAYLNLWSVNENAWWTRTNTAKTIKTVYDPCPAGFCVPTQHLYLFMPTNNTTSATTDCLTGGYGTFPYAKYNPTGKGITYNGTSSYGIWFPASGVRWGDSDAGDLCYVGGSGYYWSASPHDESSAGTLYFSFSNWGCDLDGRSYGMPVRPVSE